MDNGKMMDVSKKILLAVCVNGGDKADYLRILSENNISAQQFVEFLSGQQNQEPAAKQRDFFTYLSDDQAIQILIPLIGEEEARKMVRNWRHFSRDFFRYDGQIAWLIKAGYTLRQHAAKLGPCYKNFDYLQTWNFNDNPTVDSLVFWIPRLVPDSTSKTADEQLGHLEKLRQKYDLSVGHLADFGSVALNSGLILTHFNQTKERIPLDQLWIRTFAHRYDGGRFCLGDFAGQGLHCRCDWNDGHDGNVGYFAQKVVNLALGR